METPPYTPSSPIPTQHPACCDTTSADLLDPSLMALESYEAGEDAAGQGRAASDRLEQYISEMLRRSDVGEQVRGAAGTRGWGWVEVLGLKCWLV